MLVRDLLHVFDSDHAVTTALTAGRAWRFNLDCRCEYESCLRVEAMLHDFLEVTVAHESDLCRWLAQEAVHTRRCDFEGLLFHWEGLVDGVAGSFRAPLNKK